MATYIQIGSTVTVGAGGAASIDFSSIPSTYTDLVLKLSARGTTTSGARDSLLATLNFNGTSTTYTVKVVRASGGTPSASSTGGPTGGYVNASNFTASTFSSTEIYVPNYASSNAKSFSIDSVTEQNATGWDTIMGLEAALWNGTSAINQITLTLDYGNFAQYSTASLYGISKS